VTDHAALLRELAHPRLVGTERHARIRDVLKRELTARGFVVMEHRFRARPSRLLRGVRAVDAVNLVAARPGARVAVWLVAHYDSKGQLLSMATRLVAVALLGLGVLGLCAAAVGLVLLGWGWSLAWIGALAPGLVGAALLARNRVTDDSPGAVDNASGIVAALAAVDALAPDAPVGVVLPDAEELGLAGARALVRERAHLFAGSAVVNFDGIDDRGRTIVFRHRGGPIGDAVAAALGARPHRLLPVLVDGVVLRRAARECVTVLRGDWHTARIVHTPRDTAERLTLRGVEAVAAGVAAALTAR